MSRALLQRLLEELNARQLLEYDEIVELKTAVQEFIKRKLGEGVSYHTARTYLNDLIDFVRHCVESGDYTAGRESPRVYPWDESPANFLAGMSSLYCINLVQCSYGTEIQTQTHVRIAGQLPLCLVPALQA